MSGRVGNAIQPVKLLFYYAALVIHDRLGSRYLEVKGSCGVKNLAMIVDGSLSCVLMMIRDSVRRDRPD